MLLYRLGKLKHAHKMDGVGACDNPGRWNSLGRAMVYTSEASSTSILEVRVHVDRARRNYALATLEIPDNATILTMEEKDLPSGWKSKRYSRIVRAVGDAFLSAGTHLALRVPSAIAPGSYNILLNPAHPAIGNVKVITVVPFTFDTRLFRTARKHGTR